MSDEKFDRELRDALVSKGWVIPTTPREVLIAEEAMKDEPQEELPESLRDPHEIIRKHPEVFGRDMSAGASAAFNEHIRACADCEEPFGYCSEGMRLMRASVDAGNI